MRKRNLSVVLLILVMILSLSGCGNEKGDGDDIRIDNKNSMSVEDAEAELASLMKKIDVRKVTNPSLDIYMPENSKADALDDISTFPITVRGTGDIDIEVAAATEMSADAPDDWMNIVAKNFNKENMKINGQTVSVSVRKITSGEAVTYILDGGYEPAVFAPSNYAWGEMLEASGIGITKLTDRIAGNTAGILIENEVYDKFKEKYGEATVGNVLDATINKDLLFAYTNPYTSSTGLNILTAMLKSFDENDPLSENAAQKLIEYQKSSPPVAYTTAVLRQSAAKGVINAMVMEEQAYINTPELKNYQYIPSGIRHDHPVYTFDWASDDEQEAAKLFVEYCCNEKSQALATEKGFNRHDDYEAQDPGMTGTDFLNAQKIWKKNKNGGKPIIAVFIADVSGSMDGEPLNALKRSLVNGAEYIGSENYVGLISYSGSVTVNLPVEEFDATQRAYFSGEVKSLSASGNTATYDAVLVGLDMLKEKAKEVPDSKMMLFVLTDGEQNGGYTLDRIKGIVGGLGIPVYTIAYNYTNTTDLEILSGLNEAACIKADSTDIANQIRNLFNVQI